MKKHVGKRFPAACGTSADDLKRQHNVKHHQPYLHLGRGSYGCHSEDYERHGIELHHQAFQNHREHSQNFKEKGQHNTFSKAMSSSLRSSSSSSSSSWSSDPTLDCQSYFLQNKPQHSVSCSNLPEAGNKLRDEELNVDPCDSMFFLPHNQQEKQQFGHSGQTEIGLGRSQLHRCRSRSTEGLLQSMSQVCSPGAHGSAQPMEFYQLHKTTSLGQNLAFHDNAAAGIMTSSKRTESSIQLPSKSILKNKNEGQKKANVRKAKSMEVLSTRNQGSDLQKHSSIETIQNNIVKKKLEFSAFLDEITRQIISPSRLSSFSISTSKPSKSLQVEHKLPTKSAKQGPGYVQKSSKQLARLDNMQEGTDSSKCSHNRKSGAPQYHQHHHSFEKRPSTPESYRTTSYKENQRKYRYLLSEGSSTSPDSVHQGKNYKVKHKGDYGGSLTMESQNTHEHKGSSSPARSLAVESGSDMNNTSTTTGSNTEYINKKKQEVQRRQSKNTHSHQDSVSSMERAEFLEHYNKELHENLLQTVACIENMEAELQCTKTELNSTKEKYKRLQESYSNLQQTNSDLERKLQSVVDSMNLERKHHLQKTSELTKQLELANNTITSLENINVPSLIKQLLDKHFHSQDALKNFLHASSPAQSDTYQPDTEIYTSVSKNDDMVFVELQTGQRCSADKQEDATAFLPCQNPYVGLEKSVDTVRQKAEANIHPFPNTYNSCLHFSAVDPSPAICRQSCDIEAKANDSMVTTNHLGLETENQSISVKYLKGLGRGEGC